MFLKVFKATKVVFIYILIECSGKGDVGLDSGDPLINTAFNLSITLGKEKNKE
jgi:hypothetical protein